MHTPKFLRTFARILCVMATDNTGCKDFLLKLFAVTMWLTVIATASLGFAVSMSVGYVFLGAVVLTHGIVAIVAKYKEATAAKPIPEEFYNQVIKVVEELYADYEKVLSLTDLDAQSDATDVQRRFMIDLTRCYLGLGHPIDLNSKEGFGILYFFALTKGCEKHPPYDDLAQLKATYQQEAEAMLDGIRAYIYANRASKDMFIISGLLASHHSELRRKFLVDIYRFASIAAKADNTVTDKEAAWLGSIISLQEQEKQEVEEEEYEEEEEDVEEEGEEEIVEEVREAGIDETELDDLIGLESVKQEVETLANFVKIQQARASQGLKTSPISYHCVFTGNPGTGKTTVARILAKIYKNLGVVSSGHLVETDRAGLVAEYIGQTAIKTNKIIDRALDGVLFIDEAYSLAEGGENDYGKEAISTLLKRMEDDRERLVVILAGYTKNMKAFINSNPGLQSRFTRYIEFPDYSVEQLVQIFEANMKKYDYCFGKGTKEYLTQYFAQEMMHQDENSGNGRWARNVFEKSLASQANRLAHVSPLTTDILSRIEVEDIPLK